MAEAVCFMLSQCYDLQVLSEGFNNGRAMLLKQQRELMAEGLVSKDQLSEAMHSEQGKKGGTLLALLEMGGIDGDAVLSALARMYKVPYLDISAFQPNEEAVKLCPEKLCQDYAFIPLDIQSDELVIATDNPVDFSMLDDLRFKLGKRIKPVFARPDLIDKKIREVYQGDAAFDAAMAALEDSGGLEDAPTSGDNKADTANLDELKRGAEDSPIIKLVNGIIIQAMKIGSSDIHIEPGEKESIVRLRVDGRLRPSLKFPANVHPLVASRIKIISKLDISNQRTPQDGRTRIKLWGKSYDMRISTLPAMHGEKVVVRILDKSGLSLDLNALGFHPALAPRIFECIERPTGAILVTGPTGSGKTTTLYSFLNHVKNDENNIITVEDPVEFQIQGINQVQVNVKADMTFAAALRSILRQDPDVVMVGEIRDQETASIALHAAQTGHLVMSTLHTNDAPSTITRLVEMGIEPALVSSSVNLIVAQRLVRRLCKCKQAQPAGADIAERYDIPDNIDFFEAKGCAACGNTGYKGRMAIHEVLYMSDRMRSLVADGAHHGELMQAAREEGMLTLFADGMAKALQGYTSLDEVMRAATAPEGFSLRERLDEKNSLLPLDAMRKTADEKQQQERKDTGKKLVLVVDDSSSVRNLVKFVLEADGHEIIQASDGLEAWDMVQRIKPDLVIADCEMPNMTGPELVRRMREQEQFNDMPIVLLTSKKAEEDEVLGLEVGADDYIGKPVEPLKLQARVKKTLTMYARIRQAMQEE